MRRGRAAAAAEAALSPPLPILPIPKPHTRDRQDRSITVTKKTSAADATCFSVLPCGSASTFGFASAIPETATRAKPAVEKSFEARVAVGAGVVELFVCCEAEEEEEEEVEKEREKQKRDDGKR